MKKFIILSFIFLLSITCAYTKTLTGGVSYSVDTARKIAFQDIQYKIDMDPYQQYFFDNNKDKNLKALAKHKNSFLDRWLTFFSTTDYVVTYKKDPNTDFYYDIKGNLILIDLNQDGAYPQRSVRYDINGNLDSICLIVSPNEQFMFDPKQNLHSHWIGDNCYNTNGELIMTRY